MNTPDVFIRMTALKPDLPEFLATHVFPGRLLFAKVWGSHSHDTALPNSDVDFMAVYAGSARERLSLSPLPETIDGKGPDFQAHEAGKFAVLLRKGNPGIVECLFTDTAVYRTPEWDALRRHRNLFLNTVTLKQYLGYCRGQLHRMDSGTRLHTRGGEYNTKWAYHMIRLAKDAARICRGQPPEVLKFGEERELLMQIRAGVFEPSAVAQMYLEIEAEIDSRKPWPIPEEAPVEVLDEWLWSIYGLTGGVS